jgi:hypothetical protein
LDASGKLFAPSAYVIDEIQHALTHCKVINPILREGEYEQFPDFLPSGDVPDFRKDEHFDRALAQLIRQLKDPIAPTGTLHGVPPLPPYYIERKEVFAELGQKVGLSVEQVEAGKPLVITATSKPGVLLQGMGGLGKSTLAAALARDCTIQRQFPDGIVWLTVGRSPQITAVQESLGLIELLALAIEQAQITLLPDGTAACGWLSLQCAGGSARRPGDRTGARLARCPLLRSVHLLRLNDPPKAAHRNKIRCKPGSEIPAPCA